MALASKSLDELVQMSQDPAKLENFFNESEEVKKLMKKKDEIITQNQQLQEQNLQHQKEIHNYKTEIESLQMQYQEMCTAYNNAYTQQQQLSMKFSPSALISFLSSRSNEVEEQSEQLVESLSKGRIDYKKFVQEFPKLKEEQHLCLLKTNLVDTHQ
eukprot:TRINITY_DN3307_c0_g1_i9.p1 TRINITY_DN3307_c0_g1~~TRINITY_DN3307_c0_g1_i9.p1  ORF type:complete len:157 (-),score=47.57 TRINITY_DN3307_c0_g1_i9:4-474(-)